jgi:hypothetical protein
MGDEVKPMTDEEVHNSILETFPNDYVMQSKDNDDGTKEFSLIRKELPVETKTEPNASVEIGPISDISPSLVGGVAGLGGMALGKPYQRVANAINTPVSASGTTEVTKKPYTNAWGTKTGYGIGEGTTRQQSEAYKDVNPNKKLERGNINRRWNVDTMLEEMAKREALASESVKANKAKYLEYLGQKLGLVSNAVPRLATGLGALGVGYEGTEAYNRYRHGDYPGAVISGLGALGSGASLLPHPIPKAVGTGVALASPLALSAYDYFKQPKRE